MNELIKSNQVDYKQLALDYLRINKLNNLTNEEQEQFISLCVMHSLNPLKREIYAVKYKGKYGDTFSIIVGYEVYLKRAWASGLCDGIEVDFDKSEPTNPVCIASVYRKKTKKPVVIRCAFKEYNTGKNLWASKPQTMLRKVAVSQALRLAFADVIDGLPYAEDEMLDDEPVVVNEAEIEEAVKEVEALAVKEVESLKQAEQIDLVESINSSS